MFVGDFNYSQKQYFKKHQFFNSLSYSYKNTLHSIKQQCIKNCKQVIYISLQIWDSIFSIPIFKSKAQRNDALQNFINQYYPKLDQFEITKFFNLATNYLNSNAFTEEYREIVQQIEEIQAKKEVTGILNIYYNKEFLDKSIEEYTETELAEQFFKSTESPRQQHIFKMSEVIQRYFKKLIQSTWKAQIQNLTYDEKYYNNQIIEALRHIILQNNTSPFQMYYNTAKGPILKTFFNHLSIDWQKDISSEQKK